MIVFSKEWFAKYNKQLCWVANSFIGNWVFKFKKCGDYIENRIVRITPSSVAEFVRWNGDKAEVKEIFFTTNKYALRLQKLFYPIWITFHIWDIVTRPIPQLNLGFDTLTVYSVPGDTVSGTVGRNLVNESWATIIAGAGLAEWDTGGDGNVYIQCSSTTDQFGSNYRMIFLFDTSALTADATISAAVMSLYGIAKLDGGTAITQDIDIYTSTPASDTALANADYGNTGTTSQTGSPITYAGFATGGYNDFTLDATGRGNISKTSITKFAARNANYDVAASAPTWSSNSDHYFIIGIGTSSGTSKDPKLVVTYTAPVVAGGVISTLSLLGVG